LKKRKKQQKSEIAQLHFLKEQQKSAIAQSHFLLRATTVRLHNCTFENRKYAKVCEFLYVQIAKQAGLDKRPF